MQELEKQPLRLCTRPAVPVPAASRGGVSRALLGAAPTLSRRLSSACSADQVGPIALALARLTAPPDGRRANPWYRLPLPRLLGAERQRAEVLRRTLGVSSSGAGAGASPSSSAGFPELPWEIRRRIILEGEGKGGAGLGGMGGGPSLGEVRGEREADVGDIGSPAETRAYQALEEAEARNGGGNGGGEGWRGAEEFLFSLGIGGGVTGIRCDRHQV